jgi:hypothetical protein
VDVNADRYFERLESVAADVAEELVRVRIVSLDTFADTPEEGAAALLGTNEDVVFGADSDGMFYGDGGAGKTTMTIDLGLHLAAGDDWLGIAVPRPLRVLFIENEGPRPLFRAKLRRRRNAWAGSDLGGRIVVLEDPWGKFTYAKEAWREALAEAIREDEIDVVICGPPVSAGMEAAGTLQDVRAFLDLVGLVRQLAGRPFLSLLIHHENKGGQVSGAWEGAGDTLLHVSAQGRGRVRLHVQKARWAPETHGTTLHLVWADGESFEVEESDELDDEALAELIVAFVSENPGTGWTRVQEATPGVRAERRRTIRDRLLAAGTIVNVAKIDGVQTAIAEVPERRSASLYRADDPTIAHLRPDPDADGTQAGSLWGDGDSAPSASLRPDSSRDAGRDADADHPPATRLLDETTAAAAPESDVQGRGERDGKTEP